MKKIIKFIDRIPRTAGRMFIIISLTFSSAHLAQSYGMLIPQLLMTSGIYQNGEMMGFWIYFLTGAFSWLVFEITVLVFFMFVRPYLPMLEAKACAHYARVVFSVGYIFLGAFRLVYFFYPLLLVLGEIVIEFLILSVFAYLFYLLVSRKFIPDYLWGRALRSMGSIYLIYNGVSAAYYILAGISL